MYFQVMSDRGSLAVHITTLHHMLSIAYQTFSTIRYSCYTEKHLPYSLYGASTIVTICVH